MTTSSVTVNDMIYDALVIGGGPAGSTVSNLLAQAGRRVAVLERDRFPRFHIGESLLPWTEPVLERLGVLEDLRRSDLVDKRGATFRHERGDARYSMVFDRALEPSPPATFQVERAHFDQLLLDRARQRGATVLEGWRAVDVDLDRRSGRRVRVLVDTGADRRTLSARLLVDASGQAGFLAKRLSLRRLDPALRNVALFAHFEGVSWDQSVPPGDIQVISREDMGWVWLIPLGGGKTSVGVVRPQNDWKRVTGPDHLLLLAELERSSVVARQLRAARLRGPVRRQADFSYSTRRYAGPNWLLAGDAGSFLDPVFSTGVLLALQSGLDAADAVEARLRGRAFSLWRFQRRQRKRYEHFRRYVLGFYRPEFRDLLCQARDYFGLPAAVTSVFAGQERLGLGVRSRLAVFFLLTHLQKKLPLVERLHLSATRQRDESSRRSSTEAV